MNYSLSLSLIATFLIFFIPVEIFAHADRIMEIMNFSLSGNLGPRSEFCRMVQTESSVDSSTGNASVSICLMQRLDNVRLRQLMCKSSFLIFQGTDCNETIFNQLNKHLAIIPLFPFSPQIPTEVFVTLRWNKSNHTLRSDRFKINKSTSVVTTEDILINMAVNLTAAIKLVYRSRCPANYYGANCDIFCEESDNSSGHYNCTKEGRHTCLPGWEGLFCTEAICNGCVNGQCFGPDKCRCYHGWKGRTCSICQKAVGCKHGTCNSNAEVPFTCVCKPGWGGQYCDIDLKYCLTHKDRCQNNGTCHNYYGDSRIHYLCKCRPGYFGRHCHIKSGVCTISNEGLGHKCSCFSGFSGPYCQINDALQLEFPSQKRNVKSDGFCVSSDEGFSCSCSRFKLKMCQCKFLKCSGNSTCNDRTKPHLLCSSDSGNISHWEFFSNFGFDKFSLPSPPPKPTSTHYQFTKDPYLRFYIGSFIFIPVLLISLILLLVISRQVFHKKSKACIKTIHNDLQLPNNMAQDVHSTEHKILLHQLPLSTSVQNSTFLNNSFATQRKSSIEAEDKNISWKNNEPKDDDKFFIRDSSNHNPSGWNPNLLINHYKDMHENIK